MPEEEQVLAISRLTTRTITLCLLALVSAKVVLGDPIELFIFNGTPARIEDYPFLVSLRRAGGHYCGGVILDSSIVLTAGHCISNLRAENIEIMAGNSHQREESSTQQLLTITSVVLHPEYFYDKRSIRNDIAILLTSREFKWRRQVQPARIAPDWEYREGVNISAVGWGETEENKMPDSLFSVSLTTAGDLKCQSAYPHSYLPESTFCLHSPRKDTCNGDSGGPVTNELGELVGIVSYGSKRCGIKASVASKINVYLSWIEEAMKALKAEKQLPNVKAMDRSDFYKAVRSFQSPEQQIQDICGSNWKLRCLDGTCSCYTVFRSLATWHEAVVKCDRFGGELASIMSSEENDVVGEYVRSRWTRMWIGLNDRLLEGNYVWQNGTRPVYLNWVPSEPNNLRNEDCVVMQLHSKWNDEDCNGKLNSVCKVSVHERSPNHRCGLGWAFYEQNCYQLNSRRLTWKDASKRCQETGAHLVSIHNEGERNFVQELMVDFDDDNIWIGINDIKSEGVFEWSDGSNVDFLSWDPLWDQPNNFGNEDCVLVHKDSGKWHDYACFFKFPSVCKKSMDTLFSK